MKESSFFILILLQLFFSPLIAQDDQIEGQYHEEKNVNPMITEILETISTDSIAAIMGSMVNMGTRFMYAENRRDVASWIAGKFKSYGYTDVVLDSFRIAGETIQQDSVWQYNVVATFTGNSAPDEIYIISAHHDDYVQPDPHVLPVPGADDNASGCAVVMEIARVFKVKGFRPASTIRFVTYAAEELVGYTGYSGSIYYAGKVAANNDDIRLVINNDMVAFTQDSTNSIFGTCMSSGINVWAGDLTLSSASMYSGLKVIPGESPTSDAYRFWELGYCVAGFQEYRINPWYHTNRDSVSNCKMDFCREAVKANCAILLNEMYTPVPQVPVCISVKNRIKVSWKPTANTHVKMFNVYRSTIPDSAFSLIGHVSQPVSSYLDSALQTGIKYYYRITSSDSSNYESSPSNTVFGSLNPKNKPLLVVKDTKGGYNDPSDSAVNACYHGLFHDLEFDYSDASVADSLNIAILGNYQQIFWLSNSFNNQQNSAFRRHCQEIYSYVRDGGQLFMAGFHPSFMISGNTDFNKTFMPLDTIYRYYKISKIERTVQSYLNGALNLNPEYPELRVDSGKCLVQLPGYLMNLESISPTPDASLIYKWETGYDTNTVKGKMKGKPVGIEYLGDDFKLILLSVPLYYLDSLEAKNLVELVVNEKFRSNTGIRVKGNGKKPACSIQSYPNPCNDQVNITYKVDRKSAVTIELVSMVGQNVIIRHEGIREKGSYTFQIPVSHLPSGVYMLILSAGEELSANRMVIMK